MTGIRSNSRAEALTTLPETAYELRAVADNLGAKPEDIELGKAATVTNVKHARLDANERFRSGSASA